MCEREVERSKEVLSTDLLQNQENTRWSQTTITLFGLSPRIRAF